MKNKAVRLPVPEEVAESFKKLRSSEGAANRVFKDTQDNAIFTSVKKVRESYARNARVNEELASSHFGWDVGKMRTHFNRWVRSGGRFMSAGDMLLDRATMNKAMESSGEALETPAVKKARVKPIRRSGI